MQTQRVRINKFLCGLDVGEHYEGQCIIPEAEGQRLEVEKHSRYYENVEREHEVRSKRSRHCGQYGRGA